MKEFFKHNFKYIIQITVVMLLVILLVRSCTTVPNKNDLLEYKLDQLNKNIDSLKKSNSNLDLKIKKYQEDINKIDSTIAKIKIQRTTVNNFFEMKKKEIIGMDKKQVDSTLRKRYNY
jgi:uncharacterized protein YlxW (UPF0749 family)